MSLHTVASTEKQHGGSPQLEGIISTGTDQSRIGGDPTSSLREDEEKAYAVEGRHPGNTIAELPAQIGISVEEYAKQDGEIVQGSGASVAILESLPDTLPVEDTARVTSTSTKTAVDGHGSGEHIATSDNEGTMTPPPPPPKDDVYLDPTPKTPLASTSPSRSHSRVGLNLDEKNTFEDSAAMSPSSRSMSVATFDEKQGLEDNKTQDDDSRSEIQSIMDQFEEGNGTTGEAEIMSPRLEVASTYLIQHPPRKSSLEPLHSRSDSRDGDTRSISNQATQSPKVDRQRSEKLPPVPPKPYSIGSPGPAGPYHSGYVSTEGRSSSQSLGSLHNPPPPEPEPDLPFDFHRFLEQLRHRSADPVAGFLRSFLGEFGRKQWMVHEQVKIVSDFLTFITNKMEHCEVWRGVSDAEFDNVREGMEKLVMNRLYAQTFSPAIPPPQSIPGFKGKKRQPERPSSGRRGQHQEDVERDDVLAQKVQIYGWVQENHLDIPPIGNEGRRFLRLAQQELLKIKGYRAPRDKIICVLNCCKVIFGLLRRAGSDSSADSFVPLLILVVLQANPEHLVSNVQYILRFRNQDKLGGEAGYYLSSLMGAIQFIESLDRSTLTVSDEEFEKNVETAVSAIAEKHREDEAAPPPVPQPLLREKSAISEPEVTPRNSEEGERTARKRSLPIRSAGESSSDDTEENAAVAGLLRTIQKPLSSIGRIFSEDPSPQQRAGPAPRKSSDRPTSTGIATSKLLPLPPPSPRSSGERSRDPRYSQGYDGQESSRLSAQDAAARQASAEAAQAQRIQRAEHKNVIETLTAMFPNLDKEIIDDVVRQKDGRVGLAVDACLALSNTE